MSENKLFRLKIRLEQYIIDDLVFPLPTFSNSLMISGIDGIKPIAELIYKQLITCVNGLIEKNNTTIKKKKKR